MDALADHKRKTTILAWDPFVRVFHWSLVGAISIAAITGFLAGAPWIDVHVWAGVAAAILLGSRIVWGFAGPTHARFADFVTGPAAILTHLRELRAGSAQRHLGHNPLGGAMVIALLAVVFSLAATGAVVLGGILKAGPLAFATSFAFGRHAGEAHALIALLLLGLIALHIAGVVFESRRSRENLARAMVDGRKAVRLGDHIGEPRDARPWLTAVFAAILHVGSGAVTWTLAGFPGLGVPAAALDPIYLEECSACHIAYHPSLLPRNSWAALMEGLDDHFGENAALDAKTEAAIAGYLQENGAEAFDTKAANLLRRTDPGRPFAIGAAPFWVRTHRDVSDAAFASSTVGGRGNCEACHTDARAGRFYPGNIHIPTESIR